jgi:NAD+ kinase
VAIGGDGTTLAAIQHAAEVGKPVLGIACGSLGALTAVSAGDVRPALDRWDAGDWLRREVPALRVRAAEHSDVVAFNDIAIVRRGAGQLRVAIMVDGTLYTRLAGDGCIVSTPAGSSAYTIGAGGPLVALELEAFVVTPLPAHGGFSPPLVLSGGSQLELEVTTGYGGGRLEVDGRALDGVPSRLSVAFEPAAATVVAFSDQESHLAGLRRRGILADSPRILADDERSSHC